MTHNGKFGQKSGLDWAKTAIFAYFSIFSPKMRLRLLAMVNFTWFTTFPIFCHQSISFLEKSQKFHFWGGGISANFFEFSNFSNSFHTNVAGNDPQWQIWPIKWLRLGQNGHFCIFSIFSPKMMLRLTRNGQFHLIHNFSHLLPPKHLIFGEISKFSFLRGGVHWQFFEFSNFFNCFTPMRLENDPQWQIWPKKCLRLGQNGQFCIFFYLFPQNETEITQNGQFHLIHNFSHLLPPKHLIFGEISKIFISMEGGTSAIFWSFPTFSNCFTPMQLEMTHNGKFGQKSSLDWVKMAIFAYFSIFSPKMRLRLTRNGQFHLIHNFSHLCHQSISFLEKSQKFHFYGGGGTSAIFWSFPTFSNCFTPMRLEMTHNGKFGQKSGLDWVKMAILHIFLSFPQNDAEIDSEWSISPDSQLFPSFATKASHFWRNLKNFHFWEGGYIGNFWSFPTFSNCFTPMRLEMTHNGKFGQKGGLD